MAAAAALGVAACGSSVDVGGGGHEPRPDADVDPGVTAGTRLRPVMAVVEGAAAFLQWWDSELATQCAFRPMADGVWRCFPVSNTVVFTDGGCTEPAAFLRTCFPDTPYAGLSTEPSQPFCGLQGYANARPYERIEGTVQATNYFRARVVAGELQCDDESTPLGEGERLLPVKAIPLGTFVAVARVVVGEERLSREEWHAEDGAREVLSGFDRVTETACGRMEGSSTGDRCMPLRAAYVSSVYADAQCAELAVWAECGETVATTVDAEACSMELFEIGDPLASTWEGGEICSASAVEAVAAFARGPSVALESLPRLYRQDFGTGRIVARYDTDVAGRRLSPASDLRPLFDTELGVPCSLEAERCVPFTRSAGQRYADAACEKPLYVRSDSCAPDDVFAWALLDAFDEATCTHTSTRQPIVGTMADGATLYERDGDTCLASPIEGDQMAYMLGEAVPDDAFAKVDVQTW
jgi:hypothetical protein